MNPRRFSFGGIMIVLLAAASLWRCGGGSSERTTVDALSDQTSVDLKSLDIEREDTSFADVLVADVAPKEVSDVPAPLDIPPAHDESADAHERTPCAVATECPAEQGCHAGFCAACEIGEDCRPGEGCDAAVGTCGACTASAQCAAGLACVEGACGPCATLDDCRPGETCLDEVCSPCATSDQCAGGICDGGACVACAAGPDDPCPVAYGDGGFHCCPDDGFIPGGDGGTCTPERCYSIACTGDGDCYLFGQVCSNDDCPECEHRCAECVDNRDCVESDFGPYQGRLCIDGSCRTCETDAECLAGAPTPGDPYLCVDAVCVPGVCRSATDCAPLGHPGYVCTGDHWCEPCPDDPTCKINFGPNAYCGTDGDERLCKAGYAPTTRCPAPDGVACPAGVEECGIADETNRCAPCADTGACRVAYGDPTICAPEGVCLPVECLDYTTCTDPARPLCVEGTCTPCATHAECTQSLGVDHVCVEGQCLDGDCIEVGMCAAGLLCSAERWCTACDGDASCKRQHGDLAYCDTIPESPVCVVGVLAGQRCAQPFGVACPDGVAECGIARADNRCGTCTDHGPCIDAYGPPSSCTPDGVCVPLECLGDAMCTDPMRPLCADGTCVPCETHDECEGAFGADHLCVDGQCLDGDCLGVSMCAAGLVCSAERWCTVCAADLICKQQYTDTYYCDQTSASPVCVPGFPAGQACPQPDGLACPDGVAQCGVADASNRCTSCSTDGECANAYGAEHLCEGGVCVPGVCRSSGDCVRLGLAGSVCTDRQCVACTPGEGPNGECEQGDCAPGSVCDSGVCRPGQCLTQACCPGGAACTEDRRCECAGDDDCRNPALTCLDWTGSCVDPDGDGTYRCRTAEEVASLPGHVLTGCFLEIRLRPDQPGEKVCLATGATLSGRTDWQCLRCDHRFPNTWTPSYTNEQDYCFIDVASHPRFDDPVPFAPTPETFPWTGACIPAAAHPQAAVQSADCLVCNPESDFGTMWVWRPVADGSVAHADRTSCDDPLFTVPGEEPGTTAESNTPPYAGSTSGDCWAGNCRGIAWQPWLPLGFAGAGGLATDGTASGWKVFGTFGGGFGAPIRCTTSHCGLPEENNP